MADKSRPAVLVVDDVDMNIMILEEILGDRYGIISAANGEEALDVLHKADVLPKIILLDVFMPKMNAYEMFEIMKTDEALKRIPVIFITTADSETEALSAGAVDFISKPFKPEIVKLRVKNQIALKNYSDSLEEMVAEKASELTSTLDNTLQAMANIIEYRNLESGSHVKRTQYFAQAMISHILKSADSHYAAELRNLEPAIIVKSVALHDVGKIGIPDKILLKPGKLDAGEFEIMKTHTTVGKNIIEEMMNAVKKDSIYLRHCRDISYCHHERFDGKGYPRGIEGYAIPLAARIVSMVDVYDALVCARVYKSAFSYGEAIRIIFEGKGTQFDPYLTDVLIEIQDQFEEIAKQLQ